MTKKNRKSLIVTAIIAVVILAAAAAVYNITMSRYEYEPIRIHIPAGADRQEVSQILKDQLGSSFGSRTALVWRLTGGKPSTAHGSYTIYPGTPSYKLAFALRNGRQTPVRFTFNNLRYFEDWAQRAAAVLEADSAAFMAAADSVLSARGYDYPNYIAAFLPDTYEFYWTADPADVVNTIANYRDRFWNEERRAKAAELGLTPNQVHVIASIIEDETNKLDERGMVARVYINRLKRNMRLQSDPTLKYATGNFALRRIMKRFGYGDIPHAAYNTYEHDGLPPGPIRNVEARTIDQVLDAPEHNYVFMCARPDFSGYHVFAETFPEHRKNALKYHAALDKAGVHFDSNQPR